MRLLPPVLALLVVGGCAGSGAGLEECGRPTCEEAVAADAGTGQAFSFLAGQVFAPSCARTCHKHGQAPLGLVLDRRRAFDHLVEVAAVQRPELQRVEPFGPDDSYLMVKVLPADPRRAGDRMPRNGPPYLDEDEIGTIRSWILGGALAAAEP